MRKAIGVFVLATTLTVTGCKKKQGGTSAKFPDLKPAAAEATKLVPEPHKGRIKFTVVKGRKDRFMAVAPDGWEAGGIPNHYNPPKNANLGFMTSYGVGTNCDGDCVPKDWKSVAEKIEFRHVTGARFKVVKDENLGGKGRLLLTTSEGKMHIILARYKKGASRYFYCRATLEKEVQPAAAAFEKACRALAPIEWD